MEEIKVFSSTEIGFIGNGAMCKAILTGIIKSKLINPANIVVCGRDKKVYDDKELKELGVQITDDAVSLVKKIRIIFLCVKPNALDEISDKWKKSMHQGNEYEYELNLVAHDNSTLVSILAGTSIDTLRKALPMFSSYIRAMPNTPLQVGAGCTALTHLIGNRNEDTEFNAALVKAIFSNLGIVEIVDESKFHVITALSGSGPAYAYIVIEALADAALKNGLPRDLATRFAAQTLLGASKTLLESESLNPSELKNKVTSVGGTTIYGIHELERYGVRNAFFECITAATNRSKEMASSSK